MEILCASQSTSSVSLTMVDGSTSSTTTTATTSIQLDGSLGDGGRAIDRYNPIIRDSSRISKSLPPSPHHQPASLGASPKPNLNKNNRKSPSKTKSGTKKQSNLKPNDEKLNIDNFADHDDNKKMVAAKYGPPAADSTRYLLSDPSASMDSKNYASENMDPALNFVPEEDDKYSPGASKITEKFTAAKSPSASPCPDQVVVLRVSLHCKGCERKMRKHLSKMPGVTSFNIDFAAKKVTVVGDVTPLEVIASISKVKTIAQISTPSTSMLSSSSSSSLLPVN